MGITTRALCGVDMQPRGSEKNRSGPERPSLGLACELGLGGELPIASRLGPRC
jgi:hypothetical protein